MNRFWNPLVSELTPYSPGEQPRVADLVKLNTNENPLGPSPRVLEAIRAAATDALRLYPDYEATALRAALAAYHGLRPDQVFVGNGSDEVLAFIFAALLKHDRPLLLPDVTYSFYPAYCRLFGVRYETVAARRVDADRCRRLSPTGRGDRPLQSQRADWRCAAARRDRAAARRSPRQAGGDRRGLCRFRRGNRGSADQDASEPARRPDDVEVARARRLAGRLRARRRGIDRGRAAGEGQRQFLSARPAGAGRRGRGDRGRSLFPGEPRDGDAQSRQARRGSRRARLLGAAVVGEFRFRPPRKARRRGIDGRFAGAGGAGAPLRRPAAHRALSAHQRRIGSGDCAAAVGAEGNSERRSRRSSRRCTWRSLSSPAKRGRGPREARWRGRSTASE